eukprot:615653-Karenia_brevis.AAC.1
MDQKADTQTASQTKKDSHKDRDTDKQVERDTDWHRKACRSLEKDIDMNKDTRCQQSHFHEKQIPHTNSLRHPPASSCQGAPAMH